MVYSIHYIILYYKLYLRHMNIYLYTVDILYQWFSNYFVCRALRLLKKLLSSKNQEYQYIRQQFHFSLKYEYIYKLFN